jgi:uncharacterized protein DUF6878
MTDPVTPPPPSDPPVTRESWAASCAHQERLIAEARPVNRAALLAALTTANITHVIVTFDGYGDSGQVESIEAKHDDFIVKLPAAEVAWSAVVWGASAHEHIRIPLREAIESIVYDCLAETHQGWELSDGAFGEVTFDVARRAITLDYNERFTDSEHSQHVF